MTDEFETDVIKDEYTSDDFEESPKGELSPEIVQLKKDVVELRKTVNLVKSKSTDNLISFNQKIKTIVGRINNELLREPENRVEANKMLFKNISKGLYTSYEALTELKLALQKTNNLLINNMTVCNSIKNDIMDTKVLEHLQRKGIT